MKFLLLVIGLIWAHYGNASGYFLNDEPLIFEKGKKTFYLPQGSCAALRMSDNNIEFTTYKSASYDMFWGVQSGGTRSFSLSTPCYPFTDGFSYQFYMTVFDNAESITFEAPGAVSLLRRLVITRSMKGSIGLCGSLDFTKPFKCMAGREDHGKSDFLSSLGLSSYFLIEGADVIEMYLQQ